MRALLFSLMTFPALLSAEGYDGLYHPEGQRGWLCDVPSLGQDGGALAIREGKLFGVENTCEMSNPVSVRDMDAVLYDLECSSEGEITNERVLVARSDTGVIVLRNGFAAHWRTCE
ncbi:MAG: hypothetical protein WBC85_11690 [Planktotalea sp.]|uniref:hypothetical protein n=1 Tax=Planktotalea sp. TaxID=2029877 RepID=UPI003C78848D